MKKGFAVQILSALIGAGLSLYSIVHHLKAHVAGWTDSVCNVSTLINCDRIALSPFAEIVGVPLGVFGFAFFLLQFLASVGIHRTKVSAPFFRSLYFLTLVAGVLVSLLLITTSLVFLRSICLVCVGVYTVCFTEFLVSLKLRLWQPIPLRHIAGGGAFSALIVISIVLVFSRAKPILTQKLTESALAAARISKRRLGPFVEKLIDRPFLKRFPHKGKTTARDIMVVFVDPECPSCAAAAPEFERLFEARGPDLFLVNIPYPVSKVCNPIFKEDIHPESCRASRAALCANKTGAYWSFMDLVYQRQWELFGDLVPRLLASVSNEQQAALCFDDRDTEQLLLLGIGIGNKLNLRSTPGIYINGRAYFGYRRFEIMNETLEKFYERSNAS